MKRVSLLWILVIFGWITTTGYALPPYRSSFVASAKADGKKMIVEVTMHDDGSATIKIARFVVGEELTIDSNFSFLTLPDKGVGYVIQVDPQGKIVGVQKGEVAGKSRLETMTDEILSKWGKKWGKGEEKPQKNPLDWLFPPVSLHGEEALSGLAEATVWLDNLLNADHISITALDGSRQPVNKTEAYDALGFWHSFFYHYLPKNPTTWGGIKTNAVDSVQDKGMEVEPADKKPGTQGGIKLGEEGDANARENKQHSEPNHWTITGPLLKIIDTNAAVKQPSISTVGTMSGDSSYPSYYKRR